LGVGSKDLISPSGDLTYNLTTPNNRKFDHSTTINDILPGLFDISRRKEKVASLSSPNKVSRDIVPPNSQNRVRKPSGSSEGRCKQWKANKVYRKMVLGSDIGLEEIVKIDLCGLVGRVSYSYLGKVSTSFG
jgi:hypothetical protein